MAQAGFIADLEPENLARSDGKRPDGMTLVPWSQGESLLWDFTCRDTLCTSNYGQTSRHAGKAADMAEKEKIEKYQELAKEYQFTPVAVETLGSWGQLSLKFLEDLGSKIAANTGDKRSRSFLFQRLGIAIQRGNVISISATLPNSRKLYELFELI